MNNIKKGDVVGRISYGKDIFFIVDRILTFKNNQKLVILKGLTLRIKADSPIEDLELIEEEKVKKCVNLAEKRMLNSINKLNNNDRKNYQYGKILHLDGDIRYSQKSVKYYRNFGINAIVKNISESKQPQLITNLLERYKPDILVITGHDGMIKNGTGYNDIYNYRNSMYFMKSVKKARAWERNTGNLAIFARSMSKFL